MTNRSKVAVVAADTAVEFIGIRMSGVCPVCASVVAVTEEIEAHEEKYFGMGAFNTSCPTCLVEIMLKGTISWDVTQSPTTDNI